MNTLENPKVSVYGHYELSDMLDRITILAANVEMAYRQSGAEDDEYTVKDCVDKAIDILTAQMISGAITTTDPDGFHEFYSYIIPQPRNYD